MSTHKIMRYWITILFFLIGCTIFANAQNEQLVRDIQKYIAKVDSLVEHCHDCFDGLNHVHLHSTIPGFFGIDYNFTLKNNGRSVLEVADSIQRSLIRERGWEWDEFLRKTRRDMEWHDNLWRKVEELCPTLLTIRMRSQDVDTIIGVEVRIRRGYNERKYFQNNKLVAIIKEYTKSMWEIFENRWGDTKILETGKITLYINNGVIIHYEKFGEIEDDVRSMARTHNLRLR